MVRRLNEGFKAGPKEIRMLSNIYSVYNAIEHSNDLRKHGLSLSDYNAFPDVFKQLQNIGYAETFVKSIANFFKKNGFSVSIGDDGVNYVITFDGGVRESSGHKTHNKSFESKNTKRSGRKLKESNDFADEDIVMYYKGKKIFEGGSDELGVRAALSDLMYDDDKFYQDAKDFLENELGIEVTDIDDCAYTLADQIDTEATYADSIESFYIPFGEFEAFFKSEEALT